MYYCNFKVLQIYGILCFSNVNFKFQNTKQRSKKYHLDATEDNRISVQEGKEKLKDAFGWFTRIHVKEGIGPLRRITLTAH